MKSPLFVVLLLLGVLVVVPAVHGRDSRQQPAEPSSPADVMGRLSADVPHELVGGLGQWQPHPASCLWESYCDEQRPCGECAAAPRRFFSAPPHCRGCGPGHSVLAPRAHRHMSSTDCECHATPGAAAPLGAAPSVPHPRLGPPVPPADKTPTPITGPVLHRLPRVAPGQPAERKVLEPSPTVRPMLPVEASQLTTPQNEIPSSGTEPPSSGRSSRRVGKIRLSDYIRAE